MILPDWYTAHRPHQLQAVEEILDAYRAGADVVVLDAPTGSGKTLIAETVRQRLFPERYQHPTRTAYICSTKSLQQQFARDYPYARVLQGRSNYPTELYPDKFNARWDSLSCEDCTKNITVEKSCKWCRSVDMCPYEIAKDEARISSLAVLNTAYLLTEANYIGKFGVGPSGTNKPLDFIIADECDLLDNAVTGWVTVSISSTRVKQLGIGIPDKITVASSWKEWVAYVQPIIKEQARSARERARNTSKPADIRNANYLSSLSRSLVSLAQGLNTGGWVYTGTRDRVEFKPIWADQVAREALWRHGKKWLLMSATVINAEMLLSGLGLNAQSTYGVGSLRVNSTFPASNRPIYYRPIANMKSTLRSDGTRGPDYDELAKLPPAISSIADSHQCERILVHTVSYKLAGYLTQEVRHLANLRPIYTYTSTRDRDTALAQWQASKDGIMFAASLDRGIDLPGDACRCQIIAKIPFPNLGDRQINARLHNQGASEGAGQKHDGQLWYSAETARTLVQMTGRAVRSETDTASTYILDRQFEYKMWSGTTRMLFPRYWRDAIKWRN